MICFLEKSREEKRSRQSSSGHRVSGFECAETFPEGTGGRERGNRQLWFVKTKVFSQDRLDEGTGLEKREEALICGDHCYIIHLQ